LVRNRFRLKNEEQEMRMLLFALGTAVGLSAAGGAALADAVWCPDLKRLTDLAATKDKFSYIAGRPREGNFRDTSLPLPGWRDCSLYGSRTYTCDSQAFASADAAEKALAGIVQDVSACLGDEWVEDKSRSSSVYVALQSAQGAASMTLSTDETDKKEHIVRLILFLRGR
jgi:hypothetical protein